MIEEIIKYNCSITRKMQNAKRKVQNVKSAIKQKNGGSKPRLTVSDIRVAQNDLFTNWRRRPEILLYSLFFIHYSLK